MPRCGECGGRLWRVHRGWKERLLYTAVHVCRTCGARAGVWRWYSFYLSRRPGCPKCQTRRLTRLPDPDPIDRFYRNPLSRLQGLLGARLYRCRYCRVQFYDWRRPEAEVSKATPAA